MNRKFLEKLLENQHLFDPLLAIDNRVMGTAYQKEELVAYIEMLLMSEPSIATTISIVPNSLILSTGDLFELLRFFSFVDVGIEFILFPNRSFMGMNTMFMKVFNLVYGSSCYLDKEKNYNFYLSKKHSFREIYIFGEEQAYLEIKNDFPDAKWIPS